MSRLDDAIADTAYLLDCLMALREIIETGDCNNCDIKTACQAKPKVGQTVRYNCPFYIKEHDGDGFRQSDTGMAKRQ